MDVLNKTPGLLFTLMLIAFTIGMLVSSIIDAREASTQTNTQTQTK